MNVFVFSSRRLLGNAIGRKQKTQSRRNPRKNRVKMCRNRIKHR